MLCGTASAQIRKLGPLSGRAAVAAYGNTWLQIDRRTLTALRGLTPPAADRATTSRLLHLADLAINTGIADATEAAKSGSNARFLAAARRAGTLINTAHTAARAYGFSACARW